MTDASEMTNEPKVKELLKLSIRNIARLGRLVNSLMDFSRLEGKRKCWNLRTAAVNDRYLSV